MSYETLDIRRDARGVVYVTLNVPEKRNVLSARMIGELTEFAAAPGAARAVVLAGAGKVFCAGGDLGWMRAQMAADRATRMREARRLAEMLQALNTLPLPLIGRVHGGAFGGGVGLACVCDVAVAEEGTRFGFTETRLGLIPATIGPYVIARMGEGRARRVFMSARLFDAAEAVALGVVARAVPEAGMDAAIEAEVAPYLATAPGAVAAAKALARSLGPRIDADVIDDSVARLADTWEGDEARAGTAAFFDKVPPPWAG
ncbi:enoyl-CoA hydratase [Oceanicola granulosus HTCC2516]|uniref:Enoyl-CoA hydratase n=1 Tax=Oceanicola granulosus (strain ATCC BAA-861 / DSM 15982 / KCTC 12143 / HTCC2516) TaxID=314256 RepID=Q2CES7_OCEGH|nr:crotonase/enoyl-CoA hydratase family protein [Oceanicola granulosus]EAR51181.1 enoyl-CoA hydratase [Oceanicola granulosus HTCC2516]